MLKNFRDGNSEFTCEWTTENAVAIFDSIKHAADDEELAHAMEDAFHRWALRATEAKVPDAGIIATIALNTEVIGFQRWCA